MNATGASSHAVQADHSRARPPILDITATPSTTGRDTMDDVGTDSADYGRQNICAWRQQQVTLP